MFVERVLGEAVARHSVLLSSGTDPDAAVVVFGEASGSWGDRVEAEEVVGDFDNVPLTVPEFNQDFECCENDSVSLDAGKEFSDDFFQAGQITASPLPSEVVGGKDVIEDPFN